ncbi:Rhodanese-like protein [Schizophyllum commune H4-8]|nr:Rhodanese-like protein [Schizophyllum commune H4-8]KAI5898662.1 Rhodanese-like protein [Schizophyllum commune H4-8]
MQVLRPSIAQAPHNLRSPVTVARWNSSAAPAKETAAHTPEAKEISYDELLPKTTSPSLDAYLIDVREPNETEQGMIPSAVNLPLSELPNSLHLGSTDFKAKYGYEKPRKDQEITFYCRSGKRSTTACEIAAQNGYNNLLNYKGSWLEWVSKHSN